MVNCKNSCELCACETFSANCETFNANLNQFTLPTITRSARGGTRKLDISASKTCAFPTLTPLEGSIRSRAALGANFTSAASQLCDTGKVSLPL